MCSLYMKVYMKMKSLSRVQLFAAPWTVAYQAPASMGFSRQEYWSGLPFPSPGDVPNLGIEPRSPAFQADALTSEPPGKPKIRLVVMKEIFTYWGCLASTWLDLNFMLLAHSVFSSVQSLSRVWLFVTQWTTACQASLSIINSRSPPKPVSVESLMPSNHLIFYRPLLFVPLIFPSIRVFSMSQLAKVLEFQFQHQAFQWTPRTDLL